MNSLEGRKGVRKEGKQLNSKLRKIKAKKKKKKKRGKVKKKRKEKRKS